MTKTELDKRKDRIRELTKALDKSMIDILGYGAEFELDCDDCPIYKLCHNVNRYSCHTVWSKYIRGEIGR